MRELERQVLLSVLDRKWREHLYEMDYLREGIGLRAYSQRDPLVEYQREGFDMFNAMKEGIREETVGFLFNLEVQVEEDEEEAEIDVDLLAGADTSGASGLRRRRARGHDHTRQRPRAPRPAHLRQGTWWWQTATALGRPLEELLDLWAQTDWARVDRRLQGRERGSPFTTAGFARMVVTYPSFRATDGLRS